MFILFNGNLILEIDSFCGSNIICLPNVSLLPYFVFNVPACFLNSFKCVKMLFLSLRSYILMICACLLNSIDFGVKNTK